MKITEYCDALNVEISITYYPNQGSRWSAKFANCETKESASSGVLTSSYGNGATALSALLDYASKIQGKILVFNASGGDKRREYKAPVSIEV